MYDATIPTKVPSFIDVLKWLAPLLFSSLALWKSTRDTNRARLENSTRARQQYNSELRHWTNDCIATLSDASGTVRRPELDRRELAEVISRLSAQADQGRLFFPNPTLGRHGQQNEEAFRDFRPRILDWLIYGFRVCCSVQSVPDIEASKVLVLLKRGFTSDAQMAIDPRNLFTTMDDLQELLKTGSFMENSQQHQNLLTAKVLLGARLKSPDL